MKRSLSHPALVIALAVLVTVPLQLERAVVASAQVPTIAALIAGASPGDTVTVAAGTYVEDLTIGKPLTLNCANAGVSAGATPGTRGDESIIQGQLSVTAAGVVIDGCRFIRPAVASSAVPRLVSSSVGLTGEVVVRNSIFDLTDADAAAASRNQRGCGAGISGTAAWRVSDSLFENQFYSQSTDACGDSGQRYGSRMIFAESAQPVRVEGNRFEAVSQGVYLAGAQPSGSEIVNNEFDASNGGVVVGIPSDVLIQGNTFTNAEGIYLFESQNTRIENNRLPVGSDFLVASYGGTSGTVVRNNAILGKYPAPLGVGMFNFGAGAMDATNNWWGVTTADEISATIQQVGTVTFEPWLTSGDGVANPNPNYTTGFWPSPVGTESGPEPGSSFVAPGGVLPSETAGSGEWVQADGSSVTLAVSSPGQNQVRYEADGIEVTFTGGAGSDESRGLVADQNGEVICEVCVQVAAGQVIEVWMFSTPRLVAAHLTQDLPCQRFSVPVVSPLDGGGPVTAGAHTLQLVLPTTTGTKAVNVGVTVGGPVPGSVPAGEGPVLPSMWLLALGLVAAGVLAVRRPVEG